jgi:hypothetical protein
MRNCGHLQRSNARGEVVRVCNSDFGGRGSIDTREGDRRKKQGSSSFLKKRTKKLLSVAGYN